jgi:hypothetical protein
MHGCPFVSKREWHYHKYRKSFIRDTTEYIAVDDINEEDLGKIAVIVSEQYI